MSISGSALSYFKEIASIPHGSGNTGKISDYCVSFAKRHSLEYIRDKRGNVIIFSPASPGFEQADCVMLQGHLDMVCEKTNDSNINFLTDGLTLIDDGEFLSADKTTLGADDGIAVAVILAVLADGDLKHPALEAVLTVDEEVGMLGAQALDCSSLRSKYLINLDSEQEGIFLTGCAGGFRCDAQFRLTPCECGKYAYELELSGLTGGHSGTEIDKCRLNAALSAVEILRRLSAISVSNFYSGSKDNVIPVSAVAEFTTNIDMGGVKALTDELIREFKRTEPDITVTLTGKKAISGYTADTLSSIFAQLPNGVVAMSDELPGMVETSVNLGVVRLDGGKLHLGFCARSSKKSGITLLRGRLSSLAEDFGAQCTFSGEYAPWEYCENSHLQRVISEVFYECFGYEAKFETIHAGVECGVLGEKLPGIDAVSFGPNIYDIHTVNERLEIASVERLCVFLEKLLRKMI